MLDTVIKDAALAQLSHTRRNLVCFSSESSRLRPGKVARLSLSVQSVLLPFPSLACVVLLCIQQQPQVVRHRN